MPYISHGSNDASEDHEDDQSNGYSNDCYLVFLEFEELPSARRIHGFFCFGSCGMVWSSEDLER